MSRILLSAGLFVASALLASVDCATGQQPEKKQPAKGKFDPPELAKPDAAALKTIQTKTEQLRAAVTALRAKKVRDDVVVEVEIFLKAAENIVRFGEWFAKDSVKWTLLSLDRGLERAKDAANEGTAPWRDSPGHWVVRAYRSTVDDSIQPYAVMLPHGWKNDPNKLWRLDVVLHGRDSSLTEASFLAGHDLLRAAPKDLDFVQLEVYGRGNNAYRWAGETDVYESLHRFANFARINGEASEPVDEKRLVLRGFSMGGAGTWHIGLHHPFDFAVMGPGAGFTTTHGYIAGLPAKLPDHQEKCLRIYDAVGYAENAFNIPIVAFSGELDDQKKAADNIESLVKDFKEPVKFTHLIAPNTKHVQTPEWKLKCEAEYRKHLAAEPKFRERVRFVTYTPRYHIFEHGSVEALETTYEKAVVDSKCTATEFTVKTENVAAMRLVPGEHPFPPTVTIDGQKLDVPVESSSLLLAKAGKSWSIEPKCPDGLRKRRGIQGPIDDAFLRRFVVVPPQGDAPFASAALKQFAADWDRWFRGTLPVRKPDAIAKHPADNVVLFGDPWTNPLIADALPKLPIKWTKETLTVNGTDYDAKTHFPVMIYPNPANPNRYLVLNSGHTFKESDLKGTNALLYPRLGDWAVVKLAPTEKNPAAVQVVAAGLFDEQWKFAK
jgi:dienelactone hydrolase